MSRLSEKAVVVTGGARGLGEAYVRALAAEGANLIVNDVDEGPCQSLVERLTSAPGRIVAHVGDVGSWDFSASLIARCVQEFGRIDGLVNNAGTLVISTIEDQDEKSFRYQLHSNLFGQAFCGIHALREMISQGSGSIVNTVSGAQVGSPFRCAYSAATAAAGALTSSWACECDGTGVRVNAVAPIAFTREFDYSEPIFQRLVDAGRYPRTAWDRRNELKALTPDQNAPLVVYLLSDASKQVNGQTIRMQGKSLMLLTRPVARAPILSEEWTAEKIGEAFSGVWHDKVVPYGLSECEVAYVRKLA